MHEHERLATEFEKNRGRLRGVAYRMLGSLSEAEDAVQEAWLKVSRARSEEVETLQAWLTTVVARVCLDVLRSRRSRPEESLEQRQEAGAPEPTASGPQCAPPDPEQEALLAESVGLALLVVLDALAPAERVSFVLHDMFAVPFEEIAPIVGRTSAAARQLASRARRRVRGAPIGTSGGASGALGADRLRRRETVAALLDALRAGDVAGLLAVLDPDLVVHADEFGGAPGAPREIRGAENWARSAVAYARAARFTQPALIDGELGIVVAPRGKLIRVLRLTFSRGKIATIEVVGDPARLRRFDVGIVYG